MKRDDSCADTGVVAMVRVFDWQLGGLIDKDPPAIPVTAPVKSINSSHFACINCYSHSHPHCMYRHTHRDRTAKTVN